MTILWTTNGRSVGGHRPVWATNDEDDEDVTKTRWTRTKRSDDSLETIGRMMTMTKRKKKMIILQAMKMLC